MSKIVFSESITFSRRHNQSDGNHDATSSMSENKDRAGNDQTERENSFDFIADDLQKKKITNEDDILQDVCQSLSEFGILENIRYFFIFYLIN